MAERCIVLLAGEGASTHIVYHALQAHFGDEVRIEVILEASVPKTQLLRRRLKRLGLLPVLGQVMFMTVALPIQRVRGRRRIEAIKAARRLDDSPIPEPVHRVVSANDPKTRALLKRLAPGVVVVNGTRILSAETLDATSAPFINMHAGITPAYRGVHGGYWALVEGKPGLVGTTIHLVDEGIDTGGVIEQIPFTPESEDTFGTYPYLHTAAGLPALMEVVSSASRGQRPVCKAPISEQAPLRYHPTVWGYLSAGLRRGVW